MSQVDNQQLNNIVQDAINATANAHQKYIDALEQRLKDKDTEIERLKAENARVHKVIPQMIKTAKTEVIKEFEEELWFKVFNDSELNTEFYARLTKHIDDTKKEIAGDV